MENIRAEMKQIQGSANAETKSSVGDKYETGRAMAQLELERMITQAREHEKQAETLKAIKPETVCSRVQAGALVTSAHGIFYISVSLGLIPFNTKTYFVVSPHSPIAKLIWGKQVGDSFVWNGGQEIIQGVE